VVSQVGWDLYRDFYLGYTKKQWGRHPRDLDASVCGRIPVRFNRDDRYSDAPFQKLPAEGYTAMFSRMVDNPLITIQLGTDFSAVRHDIKPARATVYTGPLDEYFDYSLGPLAWRSLDFEFREYDQEWVQPCVQINYPDDREYTRTVEIKHTTGQRSSRTVVMYEYPRETGDPYYPVPAPANRTRYSMYRELAEQETRDKQVYFCGRLAEYRYINSDIAMLNAFRMFDRIRSDLGA
jgi:UDP-galactopyranose mutase